MESIDDLKRKGVHQSLGSCVSSMEMKKPLEDIFIFVMHREDQKTPSLQGLMDLLEANSSRMASIKTQLSILCPFLMPICKKCLTITLNQ